MPDGMAEPVSRDQILRREQGLGNIHFENTHFSCSAGHEQDWQPYPVDPYSTISDDNSYIHRHKSTPVDIKIVTMPDLEILPL